MIYGKLVAALVLVLALVGVYIKGRSDGGKIVQAEYAQRDLKAAQDNATKEREVTEKYRLKEENWQQQFVAASRSYQKGLANAETAKLAALAGIESGAIKLRLNDSADNSACGSQPPATTASASRNNASEGAKFLGPIDAAFLVSLAAESDSVVRQLQACQAILIEERK